MRALQQGRGYIDRERLRNGFAHLIVDDKILEQLGPAVNANKALFLYGAPGNGKTVIAEGLGRAIGGDMFMPYALDIDGHIITMFDPTVHQSLETDEPDANSLITAAPRDRRWVRIKRPVVMVGGELTLEMLDLTFNSLSKFYEAPIQLKANGGVFLVDDFGRQRVRPQELLNRWIVPLESRVDFLTLHTGKKFQVPFDVLIVFATNLDPKDLADEAFLRRIPYKIPVADPTVEQFTQIFELNCQKRQMPFHKVMVAYLQRRHYSPHGRPLRACHPRDLLDQVSAMCRYRGIEPTISRELLDAACAAYFVDTDASVTTSAVASAARQPRRRRQLEVR
jgi:SpoVK/Ycf46/Vps4 family AAA+-type ATPase